MPKIRIDEKDFTSPGTPGRYGNYAVLITGYAGRTPVLTKDATATNPADKIQPDENGVYEFSSKQEFLDTIGDVAVEKKSGTEVTEYHYGNKMAQELLSIGYPVIYKVITSVSDMVNFDNFWAIFKDKASYDFRFISHGLLESCTSDTYLANSAKQAAMEADKKLLRALEKEAGLEENKTSYSLTDLIACDTLFATKLAAGGFGSFSDTTVYATAYNTYHVAAGFALPALEDGKTEYTVEQLASACTKTENAGINGELKVVVAALENADKTMLTRGVYNTINGNIAQLASFRTDKSGVSVLNNGRGDCTALIELDEDVYCIADTTKRPETLIIEGINGLSSYIGDNGEYCALTVPSVHYYVDGKSTKKLPAAFHYLACFMSSLGSGFAEWYAVAGYNRGVSSYVIDHTSVKLGEIAINALEPRNIEDQSSQPAFACNVIANFRGSYYLWGNRTAALLGSAQAGEDLTAKHFLNIRQLCSTLKKQLYVSCRRFTFDPNSDTLWFNFVGSIKPTLEAMKADQGIRDYKIVKEFTDKKATLKARIRIIPIEAVEDFDLMVALEDSFGGTSVTTAG